MGTAGAGIFRGDLFKVAGELVDNYNRALEKAVGLRTTLTSFFVDKRGDSKEIREELGNHYLQSGPAHRYCIIVSPDQRDAGLIHEEFSFDNEVIDFLYENYLPSISVATRVDALYGELDDGVGLYQTLEDLLLVKKVHLEIHTPSAFMTKARTLQGYILRLRRNPELLVKNDSIVPKRILELVNEVGDVRNYNLNPVEATLELGTFYTRLFGGVVVFRDIRCEDVIDMKRPDENQHKPSKKHRKDDPTTVVIYNTNNYQPEDGPAVKFINMRATEDVLDFLVDSGYAAYSHNLMDSRITRLEDETIVQGGYDVTAISREEKAKALHDLSADMPEEWTVLRALKRKIGIGHTFEEIIDNYPANVRAMLLEPIRGDGDNYLAVEHLLTKLFPKDYEKMYFHNMDDLMEHFQNASENKRKYIGAVLGR